jgi:hypothetical protein
MSAHPINAGFFLIYTGRRKFFTGINPSVRKPLWWITISEEDS